MSTTIYQLHHTNDKNQELSFFVSCTNRCKQDRIVFVSCLREGLHAWMKKEADLALKLRVINHDKTPL